MKSVRNKGTVLWSSLLTLIPIFVGIVLWNKLPVNIATHFGADNQVNGWSSKVFTVFGLPLILLVIQLFVIFMSNSDPKNRNNASFIIKISYWLVPSISFITMLGIYGVSLGYSFLNSDVIVNIVLAAVFAVLGVLLLTVKQNYTIGIRISWTLNSKENWKGTNRLAGWIFIICGPIFLINSLIQVQWLLYVIITVALIIPLGYSFSLYQRGSKQSLESC